MAEQRDLHDRLLGAGSHQTNATRLTQAAGSSSEGQHIPVPQSRQRVDREQQRRETRRQQQRPGDVEALLPRRGKASRPGSPRSSKSPPSAIGARNQKTDGQPQCSTNAPPISGPLAEPIANISVKMPRAWLRRASG